MAKTILVGDDDPAIRDLVKRVLQGAGYDVILAKNGDDAMVAASEQDPDLIILDILMPGLSGLEVLDRLKKQSATQDIPVVLLTGVSDRKTILKGLDLQAIDYITKPFSVEELIATVQKALGDYSR